MSGATTLSDGVETRLLALGLSLLVVPFVPCTNVLSPVGFQIAERVLYLPSAGGCVLAVVALRAVQVRCSYFNTGTRQQHQQRKPWYQQQHSTTGGKALLSFQGWCQEEVLVEALRRRLPA